MAMVIMFGLLSSTALNMVVVPDSVRTIRSTGVAVAVAGNSWLWGLRPDGEQEATAISSSFDQPTRSASTRPPWLPCIPWL